MDILSKGTITVYRGAYAPKVGEQRSDEPVAVIDLENPPETNVTFGEPDDDGFREVFRDGKPIGKRMKIETTPLREWV